MRILHVFDLFSHQGGGTVEVIHKLAKAQAQEGHQVTIYTSDFKLDRDYIDSLMDVKVYPFHCISSVGLFYVIPSLVRAARQNLKNFDVIHLHCVRSFQNIVIHHYAQKYQVPYVLDQHGSLPRSVPGETRYKWLLRWWFDVVFGNRIIKDATRVIAQNDFAIREYKGFGVEGGRIAVIPLFFPVEDFADLPSPGGFRKRYGIVGKRVIMSLGRINYIKGLDFLVESFYELSRSRQDVILAVVGPDDGYLRKLESLVAKLNLGDRVLFPGFLGGQDKLAALVDADVVIQPSRYEQAAWAPIEAVLCGTPVIVSRNTGSGEDVSRMDAGYLVTYGDKEQMVQTIQTILAEPAKARNRTKRAREFISKNLRFSNRVEEYERLYTECVKEEKRDIVE